MKKIVATLMLLFAAVYVFGQDKLQKGDVIYGTITENGKPVAGVNVTEINDCNRIMAYAKTDVNGQYSFRTVNPENRIKIVYPNHETIDIPIESKCQDICLKESEPIPPVTILDAYTGVVISSDKRIITDEDLYELEGPVLYHFGYYPEESLSYHMLSTYYKHELNFLPGKGLCMNHTFYSTVDEFYDNWLLQFKSINW